MNPRLNRATPIAGIAFAVLSLVVIAITPSSPKASSGGNEVIAFYVKHHSIERTSILIAMAAFAFFLVFATLLSTSLRRDGRGSSLPVLMVVGAAVFVVGFTINAGFAFALSDVRTHLATASAQTLNVLDEDVFFAIFGGVGIFSLAAGLAIRRSAALPRWLGWSALVIGVASFTPLFGIALPALSLWTLVASAALYRGARRTPAVRVAEAT